MPALPQSISGCTQVAEDPIAHTHYIPPSYHSGVTTLQPTHVTFILIWVAVIRLGIVDFARDAIERLKNKVLNHSGTVLR